MNTPPKLYLVAPDDPILTEVMPAFTGDPHSLRALAQAMWFLMRQGNGVDTGIGLAAPQVGERVRMFVMQVQGTRFAEARAAINPEVVYRSPAEDVEDEGCLTVPGRRWPVSRPHCITAHWTGLDGKRGEATLFGLAARCFLHELGHLDGKCVWR